MGNSALSVANYFVKKSLDGDKNLKPLKLMKLLYIAHGFMLAIADKSLLDSRFDKVEAWRLGPVIPSVYHSFKIYGNSPITKQTVVAKAVGGDVNFETPVLQDETAQRICNIVWQRYEGCSDSDLVTILHRPGTPWAMCYVENENVPIPDSLTKLYYRKLVDKILKK